MEFKFLTTRRDGPVEYLTLNRPDVRNAFNEDVIAELTAWAVSAREDPALRVVVLSGAGKSFCAGADVVWMSKTIAYTREDNVNDAARASRMFAEIDALPVPVIARVHGAAFGGGAGLAAVCDIVVADAEAVFGFTEVKLGIIPAIISPFVLAKIGRSAARELFLSGKRFSAARACEIGLVHAVVPLPELDNMIEMYIKELLSASPEATGAIKALIRDVWGRPFSEAAPLAAAALARQRVSPQGQEGLRAFLDKRKPSWAP